MRERREPRVPIKISKLAAEIAKATVRFIEECLFVTYGIEKWRSLQHMKIKNTKDEDWKVGPGFLEARNIELVSLIRVSQGSWQPKYRIIAWCKSNLAANFRRLKLPGSLLVRSHLGVGIVFNTVVPNILWYNFTLICTILNVFTRACQIIWLRHNFAV